MFQELNEKAIKGLTIVVILLCVSYLIFFLQNTVLEQYFYWNS